MFASQSSYGRILRRLLLTAIALLAMAAPATAAKPHKGARYVGFEGSETQLDDTVVSAKVRVSGSGRRFRRGSYVNLTACDKARKVSLARTAISRSGRFSKSKRHGRFRYRLRGRFVMRDYARVSYSGSRSRRCASGRVKVPLYEKGVPPFKGCRSQRAHNEVKDTH